MKKFLFVSAMLVLVRVSMFRGGNFMYPLKATIRIPGRLRGPFVLFRGQRT